MNGACALGLLQRHWHAGRCASSGGRTNLQLCGLVLRVTCCGQGRVDLSRPPRTVGSKQRLVRLVCKVFWRGEGSCENPGRLQVGGELDWGLEGWWKFEQICRRGQWGVGGTRGQGSVHLLKAKAGDKTNSYRQFTANEQGQMKTVHRRDRGLPAQVGRRDFQKR